MLYRWVWIGLLFLSLFQVQAAPIRGVMGEIVWSPDGRLLAVSSSLGVWVYNTPNLNAEPLLLNGHDDVVYDIAFSPDNQTLVSVSRDHTAALWDLATGEMRAKLDSHSDEIVQTVYSPRGDLFVTGSLDGSLRVWNTDGTLHKTLIGHIGISHLAISPDSQYVVVAYGGIVRIWHIPSGQIMHTISQDGEIMGMVFTADSRTLIVANTGFWVDALRIWDVATGTEQQWDAEHSDIVTDLTMTADRSMIAISDWSQSRGESFVHIWQMNGGLPADRMELPVPFVGAGRVSMSRDGRLISSVNGTRVIVWLTQVGGPVSVLEGYYDALLHPTDDLVALRMPDRVVVMNVYNNQQAFVLDGYTSDPVTQA